MAGDNTVDIVFQAEDNASATFSKVGTELTGVQAKAAESNAAWRKETGQSADMTVNWTNLTRESAAAQEFMSGKVGKTAADFKPATAAMREASVATKDVGLDAKSTGGFMESFAGRLIGVTAAFEVLRYAAEAVKYVVTESMELESAEVRFKSLAGNTDAATTAFEGLGQAADDTNTSVVDLAKASDTLLEAGVKMKDIDETITRMGQDAKIAKVELQESANALLRASRGEVGARDIATATRLAGDETGRLQAQYKDIAITIPNIAKEMERTQRATERTRQDADRLAERATQDSNLAVTRAQHDKDLQLSAQSSFGEAHGGAGAFSRFAGRGPGKGPVGPSSRANSVLLQEFREGVAQISQEEGVNAMALVQAGEIKMGEVLQAAHRAHEVRETAATRTREDKDTSESRGRADAGTAMSRENEDLRTNLELRKEREKLQLADDVRRELQGISDSPVFAAVTRQIKYEAYLRTTRGMADTGAHLVQKAASHVGTDVQAANAIDARSAGTVVLPWSKPAASASPGVPEADHRNWFQKAFLASPLQEKAQSLGISPESAKILIQKQTEANAHLAQIVEAFK